MTAQLCCIIFTVLSCFVLLLYLLDPACIVITFAKEGAGCSVISVLFVCVCVCCPS